MQSRISDHIEWLPPGFPGWKYTGPVIDGHVHLNSTATTLTTFLNVAKSNGVVKIGSITRGFSLLASLPVPGIELALLPNLSWDASGKDRRQRYSSGSLVEDIIGVKAEGARGIKFWFGSSYFHGLKHIDSPDFVKVLCRIGEEGLFVVAHISDPDTWHRHQYPASVYGTKESLRAQMLWLVEKCPGTTFVLVHMGGNPENPSGLASSLDEHPNLYLDTSATKWVSRELSFHLDEARALFKTHPGRILFGTDIVVPPWGQGRLNDEEYYYSRYLVQRMMLEHDGPFTSPIDDPDNPRGELHGLGLPRDILEKVYWTNATRVGY